MKPALDRVGLGWATFQVLRRTNASWSKKYGVDPKVAADQRGHGLGVSMEHYTYSDLEQKRDAVRKLELAVLPKRRLKRTACGRAELKEYRSIVRNLVVPKLLKNGAGDGTRTRDVQLGNMAVDCK